MRSPVAPPRPSHVFAEPLEPRRLLAGVPLHVVAVTGGPAPGLPGVTLAPNPIGDSPLIDNAGDVVFGEFLAGTGVDDFNDYARFVLRPDAPPVVFRASGPGYGGNGPVESSVWVLPNDRRQFMVENVVRQDTRPYISGARYVGPPDAPVEITTIGAPAPRLPGAPPLVYGGFTGSWFLNDGSVWATYGLYDSAERPYGAIVYDPAGPAPARSLTFEPGFDYLTNAAAVFAVAPGGRVVVRTLDRTGANFTLLAGTPDALVPIARSGQQAVGMPAGTIYNGAASASVNAAGQVVFSVGVGPDALNGLPAIYLYEDGVVRPLVVDGTPGPLPGSRFSPWTSEPVIDDAGQLTFFGGLLVGSNPGESVTGIFTGLPGDFRLVARWGQQAPDLPAGVVMKRFFAPVSNKAGQFAFEAELAGPGVISDVNDLAVFATDAAGRLRLVFRRGDGLDVGGGNIQQIAWFAFEHVRLVDSAVNIGTNNDDGRPSSFNDRGQLVFRAMSPNLPNGAIVVADVNAGVTRVAGRRVFYNHSAFDGNDPAANEKDDAAVAPDKRALPAGGAGTFLNVTSFTRGINGLMVDIANLPAGRTPTTDDFVFRTGRSARESDLHDAPAPSQVALRRGAGDGGSDRVTLTWPDGAVRNAWLQVTVKPTPNTGLSAADTFTFGNLVAETGDAGGASSRALSVTPADYTRTAGAARTAAASITDLFDFNRDGRVNVADLAAVRGAYRRSLQLPVPPTVAGAAPAGAPPRRSPYAVAAKVLA